jgi:hypothetical protein
MSRKNGSKIYLSDEIFYVQKNFPKFEELNFK